MPAIQQKIRSGLVELHTNVGLLYARPSFWERIYLLWTFRNFHRLPQQVLNRYQMRLIEELCLTATVAGKGSIARSSLIGAVESVFVAPDSKTAAAASARKLVMMSAPDVAVVQSPAVGSERISSGRNRPAKIRADGHFPGQSASVQFISASRSDSAQQTQTKVPDAGWTGDRNSLGRAVVAACGVVLLATLFHFREGRLAPPKIVSQVAIETQNAFSRSLSPTAIAQLKD